MVRGSEQKFHDTELDSKTNAKKESLSGGFVVPSA